MRITINVKEKHAALIILFIIAASAIGLVVAYGTTNPAVMGHTWGEMVCDNTLCANSVNGRVGIGTTGPGFKLDVVSDTYPGANFQGSGAATGISLKNTGTGGRNWYLWALGPGSVQGAGKFSIYDTTAGDRLTIDTSGNVGIGTTGPNHKLEVAGDIYGSGGRADCGTPYMELSSCRNFGAYYLEACNFRVCNGCGCSGWNPGGTQITRAAPGY